MGFDENMQQTGFRREDAHRQGYLNGDFIEEGSAAVLSSIEHTAFNERQTNQN